MSSGDVGYVQMQSMEDDAIPDTVNDSDVPETDPQNPPSNDEDYVNVEEAAEEPAQQKQDEPPEEAKDVEPQPEPAVEQNDEPEPQPEDVVEAKDAEQSEPPAEEKQPEPAASQPVVEEEKPPEPKPIYEEPRLASEPAMMMPSTSDPTQDDDLIPRTDTAIEKELNEPLIGREETFTAETFEVDENPVRKSTGPNYLSPHPDNPEMEMTESKRALLEEEQDGTVIRFGNYDIRYKEPREVFCSTDITLLAVHLKEQTFEVEVDMRLFWLQPEIEEDVPHEATWSIYDDGKSLPIDPDDMFEHDTGVEWIQQEFHYHHDTKVVEWQCQFRDTFSERMELRRFPVDRQFLNILLQGRVKPKEGNWVWIAEPPKWAPPSRYYVLRSRLGQSISDYELFSPWADLRVIVDDDGEDNQMEEQPPFKLRLRVQRYTGYYLGNINVPMFLIVAVCLVSLVMPPDNADLANRLSVTVTSMLAGVAFRFVVSDMLPPVNYLTWMDYYVGVSFGMVSLFIFENALATIMQDSAGKGQEVDFWFGGLLMVLWVLINLFFWYACWSNVFRIPWDVMDMEDRMPSELDTFQASPPDQTQGADPKDKMDDTTIKMAMLRQLSTQ